MSLVTILDNHLTFPNFYYTCTEMTDCKGEIPKIKSMIFFQKDTGEMFEVTMDNITENKGVTFKDYSLIEKAKRGIRNQYFMVKRLIGLMFILSFLFASCKKCADCTVTVTQKVTGQPATTGTSTTELCGDDLKEADGNTTTAQSTVNGYTAVITTKTECN